MLESVRCGRLPGICRYELCDRTGHRLGTSADFPFWGPYRRCVCGAHYVPPAWAGPIPGSVTVAARAAA